MARRFMVGYGYLIPLAMVLEVSMNAWLSMSML